MQFKGDPSLARLPNLQEFVTHLKEASIAREKDIEDATTLNYDYGKDFHGSIENEAIKIILHC